MFTKICTSLNSTQTRNVSRIVYARGFAACFSGSQQSRVFPHCVLARFNLHSSKLLEKSNSQGYKDVKTIKFTHSDVDLYQVKKRSTKKKWSSEAEGLKAEGFFNVTAYATAEEYDLEGILDGIEREKLYVPKRFFSTDNLRGEQDVLYVTAKYPVGQEPRDIFFFREGSVVLWNCDELESANVLAFVRDHEKDRYRNYLVKGESEVMPCTYVPEQQPAKFLNGKFYLSKADDNFLEKYTFSNALATSIKLGIWEATLDRYIESMEFLTVDMKRGSEIRISRQDLLRKTGELFALRHLINLSSDLLDTPDFYWDREEFENLYLQICAYFSISRRTKVMNEKLNHCVELAELVSSHLNDTHHVRLEWMIIILIMVEVGFEILHYVEVYYSKHENENVKQDQMQKITVL